MRKKKQHNLRRQVAETTVEPPGSSSGDFPWKKMTALSGVVLMAFLLHIHIFSSLGEVLHAHDQSHLNSLLILRAFKLLALVLLFVVLLVLVNQLITHKLLNWALNMLIWLFLFLYVLEAWLSISPCSQGNTEAYVSELWFKKYWYRNKYGFRDKEFDFIELSGKKVILFMGDSYVAGHGIKDPDDRSSNILQRHLGDRYFLVNAGNNGSNTRNEFRTMRNFPVRPDIVLWSHVINDIEDILPPEQSYASVYRGSESGFSQWLYGISRNSVFLDLAYHFLKSIQYGMQYKAMTSDDRYRPGNQYKWYQDSALFNRHLADLQVITDYVRDTLHSSLIFITYPEYGESVLDSSDLYVNQQIQDHLVRDDSVHYLNTTPFYHQVPQWSRRVNLFDGHPSKKIHRMVADSLFGLIRLVEKP